MGAKDLALRSKYQGWFSKMLTHKWLRLGKLREKFSLIFSTPPLTKIKSLFWSNRVIGGESVSVVSGQENLPNWTTNHWPPTTGLCPIPDYENDSICSDRKRNETRKSWNFCSRFAQRRFHDNGVCRIYSQQVLVTMPKPLRLCSKSTTKALVSPEFTHTKSRWKPKSWWIYQSARISGFFCTVEEE